MLLLSLLAVMSGYSSLRGLESFMKRHPKEGAELFGLSRAKLPSYLTLRDMAMPVNAKDVTEMIQAHRGARKTSCIGSTVWFWGKMHPNFMRLIPQP